MILHHLPDVSAAEGGQQSPLQPPAPLRRHRTAESAVTIWSQPHHVLDFLLVCGWMNSWPYQSRVEADLQIWEQEQEDQQKFKLSTNTNAFSIRTTIIALSPVRVKNKISARPVLLFQRVRTRYASGGGHAHQPPPNHCIEFETATRTHPPPPPPPRATRHGPGRTRSFSDQDPTGNSATFPTLRFSKPSMRERRKRRKRERCGS